MLILSAPATTPTTDLLTASFAIQAPYGVVLGAAFGVRSAPPINLTVQFRIHAPLPAPENAVLENDHIITGLPGDLLTFDLTLGAEQEAEAVVAGLFPLATPTISAHLRTYRRTGSTRTLLGEVGPITFTALNAEPRTDLEANTTTFRFRNSFDHKLRGERLPELVPWQIDPSDTPCPPFRRVLPIGAFVADLMREVDPAFQMEADPLAAEQWEETRAEFSTLNLTRQQAWDATYGLLGMQLWTVQGADGPALRGVWPNPVRPFSGTDYGEWRLTDPPPQQARDFLHVPTALTLRGRDEVTVLDWLKLMEWVGPDPAHDEVLRELQPNAEWFDEPESAGTARVSRGYRKSAGNLVAQIEVTTDDVEVRETIDGQEQVRVFSNVGTGVKSTETLFDPACLRRPLVQRTRTRAWACHLGTQTSTYSTPGPSLNLVIEVGEVVADEETYLVYGYSAQGYQSSLTTQTRRLASVQQVDPEKPPLQRGATTGYEYVTTTRTERWSPTGGGRWRYDPGVQGQTLMPLYDQATGEAVRTISVTRATPDAPRLIEQAPPSYDCFLCPPEARDATGAEFRTGDAGHADPREVSLPFLAPASLERLGAALLASDWARIVTDFGVPFPVPENPGDGVAEGRVQTVRIAVAQDASVTSTLRCAQLDGSLLSPDQAGMYDLIHEPSQGKAVALVRRGPDIRARVVTGWSAAGTPIEDLDALIAFPRGTAAPGEEIEWRLVRGRREATSAR